MAAGSGRGKTAPVFAPTHTHHPAREMPRLAVLTVSDTRTEANDLSGQTARRLVEAAGCRVVAYRILPDDPAAVSQLVHEWLGDDACDGVLTTGGTGISSRDRTYEALADLLDKTLDGFGELFRLLSYDDVGSAAMLSRAVGGVARGKLLFALPGSPRAVELALQKLILPEIAHLLSELRR
jgi:molybdenum cofactor biosynthesis protein B